MAEVVYKRRPESGGNAIAAACPTCDEPDIPGRTNWIEMVVYAWYAGYQSVRVRHEVA